MRRIYIKFFALVACVAAFAGCTHEDKTNCPGNTENVMIAFTLKDGSGKDLFPANVNRVEVFVFDAQGKYYNVFNVDKPTLNSYQGAALTLPPGQYSFIFWANTNTRTSYCDLASATSAADSWLDHIGTDSCDPLYFAPSAGIAPSKTPSSLSLTVPAGQTTTAVVDFMCAHKTIDVFVENFHGGTRAAAHKINLKNVYRGYDFTMRALKDYLVDFEQDAVEVTSPDGVILTNATFNATNFGDENTITINLKQTNGMLRYTLKLNDFIRDNDIDLSRTDYIPILIRFLNGSVEISLPGWASKPIKPEIS